MAFNFCKFSLLKYSLFITRTTKNTYRNMNATKVKVSQTIIIALLMILVFWDLGTSERDMNGKSGFFFILTTSVMFNSMNQNLLVFVEERPVFLREYASKTYNVWSYYVSKSVVEIPFDFIAPVLVSLVIYWPIGLTEDVDRFFIFTLTSLIGVLISTSFGFLIGCAVSNPVAAPLIALCCYLPPVMFSGYLVNLDDIFVGIAWIQYISPIRFMLEALQRNEFEDNSRYVNGELIFERYHYDIGLGWCLGILAIFTIIIRLLGLLVLKLTMAKG